MFRDLGFRVRTSELSTELASFCLLRDAERIEQLSSNRLRSVVRWTGKLEHREVVRWTGKLKHRERKTMVYFQSASSIHC
nr:hypothetical protein Itr_chr14CG18890 [Ipomoea trifida]